MKSLIVILLLTVSAQAQEVVLVNSRRNQTFDVGTNNVRVIDAVQSRSNEDYRDLLLRGYNFPANLPALIDHETGLGVTITGTIAQAQADLAKAVSNMYPATVRLIGVDRSQYAESGRTNSNNGAAAMRGDLTKLFEMVAEINERLERLEAR